MLEGLQKKFTEEFADVEAAETSRVQNYDINMIQLTDLIKHSKADREAKATTKANRASEFAKAKGDLADGQPCLRSGDSR